MKQALAAIDLRVCAALRYFSSRSIPNALSTCFSYRGSDVPFFILYMKYFSNATLAKCTHLPFLNQLTLRGGICGRATKAAPVSPMSARQIAFQVPWTVSGLPATCNNLTVNTSAGVALVGPTTVNGTLTLTSGQLTLGANNLTLDTAASVSGTPSASNMVVAEGAGEMRKQFSATGSFTFPVGDNTSTAEYSPVTLDFTSGAFSSAYAAVRLTDAKHASNTSTTDYVTRYWTVTSSGISGFSCAASFIYVDADICLLYTSPSPRDS